MDHCNIEVSKKYYSQGNFAEFCRISHITTFAGILEEDWATLQLLLISHSTITISKIHKKFAVRAIFKKIGNLRNFAFNKFSYNLGFQPFYLTT